MHAMYQDQSFGEQLREWRQRRRMSQLDLAAEAELSTRHLSFVETGRAKPSREMVQRIPDAHMPFPALAVHRHWELVAHNAAVPPLMAGAAPHLVEPPVNVLRLSLHPEGIASRIVNLAEWKRHIL